MESIDAYEEKLKPLFIAGRNAKWCSFYGKIWEFLDSTNLELPCDPAIPKEFKTCEHVIKQTFV